MDNVVFESNLSNNILRMVIDKIHSIMRMNETSISPDADKGEKNQVTASHSSKHGPHVMSANCFIRSHGFLRTKIVKYLSINSTPKIHSLNHNDNITRFFPF